MVDFDGSIDSEVRSSHSMESLEQDEYLESVVSTSERLGTKMLHQLNEFRQDETLCDAKLRLEGKEFDVHKVVLSSSCPYFRTLFTANMKERKQSVIDLKCPVDLVHRMDDFLTFLYTTKVQLTQENVEALIVAADYFNVTELKELGCRFLQQNVNLSNGIALHGFAGRYHCEPLRELTRDFLVENFTAISQTEDYLLTDPEQLLEIVSSDELVLFAEEELYEGILRWVKHDLTNRVGFFPKLFGKVRLQDVSRTYLAETIANEKLVTDDPICSDLLMRMILECYVTEDATKVIPSRFYDCVFVNGGREPSGATASSYLFVPSQNAWFKIPSMSTVRYSHGVATIGDDVFVLGGYSKNGFTAEVEKFDVKARKWSTSQPLPTPMKGMAVAAVGNSLYVAGGIVENGIRLGILKRYDPATQRWEVKTPLHVSRSGASLVTVGDFLYAIGGKASDNQMLSSMERYSITADTWERMSEMSHKRAYAVAASVGSGNILVVGGINEVGEVDTIDHVVVIRTYLRSCEMYNSTAGVWFPVADLSVPRAFAGITVHGEKVYVFGGEGTGTRYHNSVECYDCTTNKWDVISHMPEPKKFLQCCKLMLPQGLFRSLPSVSATS
ncbi:kelch 20 [Paramuricea clavata]|uniref:Kelch 20 n=1 Tax=Paramuricea clavata TaxID=317549 RepID=A0A6S7HS43_PARCT|nr:kelch 20 [Paramuricea clavata]